MIELSRIERAVLTGNLRPRRTHDRLADQAGERQHAEAVANPAQRVASSQRLS